MVEVPLQLNEYLIQSKMLLDNEEKKREIWWKGFLHGSLIGIFAGITIAYLLYIL